MNKFLEKIKNLAPKKEVAEPVADLRQNLDKTIFVIVAAIIFVSPLLFVPALTNWFDQPKAILVSVGALIAMAIWLFRYGLDKKLDLTRSIFDLPALLFVVIAVISACLATNRVQSLVADPIVYAGGFLLFLLVGQITKKENQLTTLVNTILASGAILSLWTVIQIIGSFAKVNFPLFNLTFSPTGSFLVEIMFLAAIFPLAIGAYLKTKKFFGVVFLVLIIAGLALSGYALYQNPPALLDVGTGWKISTGTMGRSPVTAIFGMGPANFIDAFTLYKPVDFNTSKLWNLRFTGGANFYFYVLSTVGIAGLAALLVLVGKLVLTIQKRMEIPGISNLEKGLFGSLAVILAIYLFLPGPIILTVTFFALLGLLVAHYRLAEVSSLVSNQKMELSQSVWLSLIPAIGATAICAATVFFLGKIALADYYFAQSYRAAAANLGTETYNLQIQAINLYPENDAYRVSYSQTNLALADALAGQANLTDQQKATVVQLVQQAIREARTAAAINPNRASNWENMAAIYRALINFAQGADQWTIASLNQAIALNPTNPQIRLDLGGLYFAAKDFNTAGQLFGQAVNLKPDFANAHYNLAQAYKNLNANSQALIELQSVASLVCAANQTADCDRVNAEINDLNKPAPEASAESQLQIATPSARTLPKVKVVPPVRISSPSGEITP